MELVQYETGNARAMFSVGLEMWRCLEYLMLLMMLQGRRELLNGHGGCDGCVG